MRKLELVKNGHLVLKDCKKPSFKKVASEKKFFENLYKLGYRYFITGKRRKSDKLVIKAFQQRYYQKRVTGKIDQKTFEISELLQNK